MKKIIDLTGKKFGKLTAISQAPNRKTQIRWNCKCDCGKEKIIQGGHLRNGHTSSCGCSWYRHGEKHPTWKGYKEISSKFFQSIKSNAKNRHIDFVLKIEQLWDLFISQNRTCALSGLPLIFEANNKKIIGTASLDRIDSKKGYYMDNVQWVHKDINFMKQEYPLSYFLELCNKVSNFKNKT